MRVGHSRRASTKPGCEIQLEEFWNDLAGLQTFSLLCAYYMDNLDQAAYSGPLDCICRVHSHLIAVRDYKRFNEAVVEASEAVLDQTLAQMLLSLSERHRPQTAMTQPPRALTSSTLPTIRS